MTQIARLSLLGLMNRIAFCVVLGAASSVVVAWALGAWAPAPTQSMGLSKVASMNGIAAGAAANAWVEIRFVTVLNQTGISHAEAMELAPRDWGRVPDSVSGYAWISFFRSGWPFKAMTCTVLDGALSTPVKRLVCGGADLGAAARWSALRVLPLTPIWVALGADTAIHATGWIVAIGAALAMRRRWRRHRGLCPECGYDLRQLLESGCSECGWGRTGLNKRKG